MTQVEMLTSKETGIVYKCSICGKTFGAVVCIKENTGINRTIRLILLCENCVQDVCYILLKYLHENKRHN